MRPYLHLAWLDKRDVENHITDRPHPAAKSVRIASAAFPRTFESPTARKLANNSSITNKEHLDRCPIPDNDPIHRCRGKYGHHFENQWPRLRWNRLLLGSSVGSSDGEYRQETLFVYPNSLGCRKCKCNHVRSRIALSNESHVPMH